jgi:hypothetical protein
VSGDQGDDVRVRIGISESREIEIDVDDEPAFRESVGSAFSDGGTRVLWVTDTKYRSVGIPVDKIAYVEIESVDDKRSVGFASE